MLGGSRQEALSVPERVRTLAREVGEENVVVILDQNLTYPDGDVLGTDLAAALRRDAYGGTIVIQSANAEPSDCITYADAGADGTLAKGVLAATSAAELALIFGAACGEPQAAPRVERSSRAALSLECSSSFLVFFRPRAWTGCRGALGVGNPVVRCEGWALALSYAGKWWNSG